MEEHRLALNPGYQIDQLRIETVLGKGGFGITYLAQDLQLGKRVAIKELLPDSIATREDGVTVVPQSASLRQDWDWARERFLEEAKILAAFSHPAIVSVHRLIEQNGTVYMVMDYLEGESYEAKLRRIGREPSQEELMNVMVPLLGGLQEVHRHGLIHRDIKPENILINRHGQPVLIDFGSARSSMGVAMTTIVTHGYSPIEQYQEKGRMGAWTDIYAMGAVACRAITGKKPPVAADRVLEDGFVWMEHLQIPGYSAEFLGCIDWALRVKPDERPQDIATWAASLGGGNGGATTAVPGMSPPATTPTARVSTRVDGQSVPVPKVADLRATNRKWIFGGIGGGALLILVALGILKGGAAYDAMQTKWKAWQSERAVAAEVSAAKEKIFQWAEKELAK